MNRGLSSFGYIGNYLPFGRHVPYVPSVQDIERAKKFNLFWERNSWHWQHRKYPTLGRDNTVEYRISQPKKLNTIDLNKAAGEADKLNRATDKELEKVKEAAKKAVEKKEKDKEREEKRKKEREERQRREAVQAAQRRAAAKAAAEKATVQARVDALKAAVERKKAEKTAAITALREKHKKQTAYGRDVKQAYREEMHKRKVSGAGYVTEAEKLMGGRSGYYKLVKPKPKEEPEEKPEANEKPEAKALSGFGMTKFEIKAATTAVQQAARDVQQTTKDVKLGIATKDDLKQAIARLEAVTKAAKSFSGWDGWDLAGLGASPLMVETAAEAVEKASAAVKQVTKDVKAGVATKSDLEAAIADLEAKAKAAEALSGKTMSGFGGFGSAAKTTLSLGTLALIGFIVYFVVLRPKKEAVKPKRKKRRRKKRSRR